MHISGLNKLSTRLTAIPVVRGGERPIDIEVSGQAFPEVIERLDIAEGLVYMLFLMAEVGVCQDESTAVV